MLVVGTYVGSCQLRGINPKVGLNLKVNVSDPSLGDEAPAKEQRRSSMER